MSTVKQAVILAGGRGTRLKSVTGDLPKPLVDVDGKPLLVHQFELLRAQGIEDVLLLTGYRSDAIREVAGDGRAFGLNISYQDESEEDPLGTAGALLACFDRLKERAIVAYGDCMLNVDLGRLSAWHEAKGAAVTLLVHPNSHPEDSDLVELDGQCRVKRFHPYPHEQGRYLANLVNAALYVVNKAALAPYRNWDGRPKPDIAKHLFPRMVADGVALFGYRSPEYIKDIGTPARHATILRDLRSGRIARSSLNHPQKAIFLDRDGTLNVEVNRVSRVEDFEMISGVPAAIKKINESEFRAIVVTNQPVLARGDCDEATLDHIHAKLDTLLGHDGAYLDALYYCPHHPHKGYEGEVVALKFDCECRKPKPGLLLQAQQDFNINLAQSWMIGDTTVDIRTANTLGIRSILVGTGKAGQDGQYPDEPTYRFATLAEAVDFILSQPD
ncbi:D,D-heptose 1,7-bisphosphate phosphatase [Rhizomicrobium palustre]|uniref:D,D-heptose 1,7-bisphosphate phosphatase n=1 Tax=Rhizomicrobium palustre TaxID=189966 RepID=A0A846MUZ1_9PROT|nr:D,D-heptose 1,7-bisphosphate phosphatase [Rhizomicrobium palustre]